MPKKRKANLIDDGFNARFVEGATFYGLLEIPGIKREENISIPKKMIPFSKRRKTDNYSEALVFYEYDLKFRELLINPDSYIEELSKFQLVVSPDCSLYFDMPLALQIVNTYLNRQIGYYLQSREIKVIPNIRWSDERTYLRIIPSEVPFAFLGVERNSIVSLGAYGCSKTKEEKKHLREGLRAMLKELEPKVVLVYGAMPDEVFNEFLDKTKFIHFPDWTSQKHER